MRIRIEVPPDRRRFAAAESYVLARRRSTWRLLALSPIAVGVMLLFGGLRAWVFGIGLIAVGVLEATLVPWLQPRLAAMGRLRDARHPEIVELHDDGVRCVTGGYALERPWSVFRSIVALPDQYLLLFGERHYVAVPTGSLSEDQLGDLRRLFDRTALPVTP